VNSWASALACRERGGSEQRDARNQQGWRLGDDKDWDGLHGVGCTGFQRPVTRA